MHRGVIASAEQPRRHLPQLREALVEVADATGQVGDEDAVPSRFERGAQVGDCAVERAFDAQLRTAVVQRDHVQSRAIGVLDAPHAARDRHGACAGAAHQGVGLDLVGQLARHLAPKAQVLGRAGEFEHVLAEQLTRLAAHHTTSPGRQAAASASSRASSRGSKK